TRIRIRLHQVVAHSQGAGRTICPMPFSASLPLDASVPATWYHDAQLAFTPYITVHYGYYVVSITRRRLHRSLATSRAGQGRQHLGRMQISVIPLYDFLAHW